MRIYFRYCNCIFMDESTNIMRCNGISNKYDFHVVSLFTNVECFSYVSSVSTNFPNRSKVGKVELENLCYFISREKKISINYWRETIAFSSLQNKVD
jgi:hypothetical protein